jgi:hypothetical protein
MCFDDQPMSIFSANNPSRVAIAMLGVKVKPLRGRFANPDPSARGWLLASVSLW